MTTKFYQRQDAVNTLYGPGVQTASGNSAAINFDIPGGCLPAEIIIAVSDLEANATLLFVLQDFLNNAFVDTPYQLAIPALGNGNYIWPVDGRIITGSQMRLRHIWTPGTDSDGFGLAAHLRPYTLGYMV